MTLQEKIERANEEAVKCITDAEPYWVDVLPAGECLENFKENTILHSGPPIAYENMCGLHKRGMINAVLFEGWAKTPQDAEKLILAGKVNIDSAFNYNTVGSGTGIVTKSVPLLVAEDKRTGKRAGVFPAEGKFGGGFCGWGVYSQAIAENLRYMREELFSDIRKILKETGGIALKSIIAKGLEMGDENHSSQTAVDLLFLKAILPYALKCKNYEELILYFVNTGRFFHNFGQAASRCGIISADGIPYSGMVTAAGGNGVEYGIKVAGLGDQWFTAPSPMIEGTYMTPGSKREDQLPWIGDSSIVECAGLGGIVSAASPVVCSFRGDKLEDSIKTTRDMEKISITKNKSYRIPNLDFDNPPAGIDILKVAETGILPVIDGGMINRDGGWMGAGCARIPMECFEKAAKAFWAKYGG
ncbi:MAG: DUF1116 domain-containing protein [Lachnospiraceae bacterium]|nr:DUF1116 domain-containing protein [Lachnospiraceae bacterium]